MNESDRNKLEQIDGNTQADNRQLSHVVEDMLTRGVKQTRLQAEGAAVAMRKEIPANVIADDLLDGDISSPRNYNRLKDDQVQNLNKMPGALFRGGTRDGSISRWQRDNEFARKYGEATFTDKDGYVYETISEEEESAAYDEAEKVLEYYIENEETRLPIELLRQNDYVEFEIETDENGKLLSYYPTGLVTDLGVAIDLLDLARTFEARIDEGWNFATDPDKMRDFFRLTKEEFLTTYSYLTEQEYEATKKIVGFPERDSKVRTTMEEQAIQSLVDDLMFYSSPINKETRKGGGMSREEAIRMTFEESTLGSKLKEEALRRFDQMASSSWMANVERDLIGTPAYEAARQAMIDGQDVFWDSGEVQNPESTIGLYSLWDYYDRETGLPLDDVDERGYMKFKPHMMYNPETGEAFRANKPEDHERMSEMGFVHEDKLKQQTYNAMKGYPEQTEQMILDYVAQWVKDSVGAGPAIEEWEWDSDEGILRIYTEKVDPDCDCTTTDMSGRCVSCGYSKVETYTWDDIFNIDAFPSSGMYHQALAKYKYGMRVPYKIEEWNGKEYFLNGIEEGKDFVVYGGMPGGDPDLIFNYDIVMPPGSTFDDLRSEPDSTVLFTTNQMKRIDEMTDRTYYKKYNYALPPGTTNALPMVNQRTIDGKRFTANMRGFPSKNQARAEADALRQVARLYRQPINVRTIKLAGGWRNYVHVPNIGKAPFSMIPNWGKISKDSMQNSTTQNRRIARSMIRERFPSINQREIDNILNSLDRKRKRRGRMA